MDLRFRDASAERVKAGLLVIPVREKRLEDAPLRALDRALRGNLRARIQKTACASIQSAGRAGREKKCLAPTFPATSLPPECRIKYGPQLH